MGEKESRRSPAAFSTKDPCIFPDVDHSYQSFPELMLLQPSEASSTTASHGIGLTELVSFFNESYLFVWMYHNVFIYWSTEDTLLASKFWQL